MNKKISLKQAIDFHGHLGPYLILGLLAGEFALRKLRCKKYFGLQVKVWGANKKPKSCLIDGLQLSTGATYGKGNIEKLNSSLTKIIFRDRIKDKKITLRFRDNLSEEMERLKTHKDSENFAKKIYKISPENLFIWRFQD